MFPRTELFDHLPRRDQVGAVIFTFVVLVSVLPAGSFVGVAEATATGGDDVGFTALDVTTQKGQSTNVREVITNWSFEANASVDKLVIEFEDSNNGTIPTTDTNPRTVVGPDDPGGVTVSFRVNDKNQIQLVRVTQITTSGSVYECVATYDDKGLAMGDFSCSVIDEGDSEKLTTSPGTTEYTQGGGPVVVDGDLVVNGSSYDSFRSARVSVDDGFDAGADVLTYDESVIPTDSDGSRIVTGTYNQTTGVLNFTGTAVVDVYQDLLRTVRYNNTKVPPTTADRNVTFTLTAATQDDLQVYYNPTTDHYYEYVENRGVTWTAAETAAASKTYAGMDGYLATVTSEQENDFLLDRFQAGGWIGASDSAAEGEWRWVTGPEGDEDGGAGRHFFNQTAAHVAWTDPYPAPPAGVPGGGSGIEDAYSNWNPRHEPDNKFPFFGGQDYAYLCHGPGSCPEGMWKDASANSPPFTADGYFVEYGGPNVQPETEFTNITGGKTVTIVTTSGDTTPPTASAAANETTVSPGATILLDGSGSDGTGSSIVRYEWDTTGNGRTDLTGVSNTTSFQNASNYTIMLTVTDEGGNTDTDTVTVTVEDTNPPNAAISVNGSTTVERGEVVQFTGTNSTDDIAIESFEWDFGDGSANSTEVSPTHGFDRTGTYTVTLVVNDTSGNTDSDTVTIDVVASPRPAIYDFNGTNPDGANLTVSLTADQLLDQITVDVYDTSQLSPRADDSSALEFTLDETDFASPVEANGNYTYTNTTVDLTAGNYTLRLQQAENTSNGDSGTGQEATVTIPGESTPPSFNAGYPTVRNATTSGFDIVVNASEDGTAYYVVVADGATAPSTSEITNGQNASGQSALASGSSSLSADSETVMTVSGLSENTAYDVYVVAEDGANNTNTSSAVDAATIDGSAPTVTIDSPTSKTYGADTIALNVSADESISTWKYALDGGSNQTFTPNTTLSGLSDGQHTLTIYATDDSGNVVNKTVTFTIDTTAPTVAIESPTATTYGADSVPLNVSANENITTWEYSLDGGSNQTFTPNTTIGGLGEGQHTITVYATDEGGNVDSSTVTFTVDTVAPTVTIDSPTSKTYGTDSVPLNVSADESISSWKYSLDGGSNQSFTPNGTLAGLSEGQHTVTVYAVDDGGNVVNKTVTFTIDTTDPTVMVESPTETTYGADSIALNVSADETISTWEYALDGGSNQTFTPNSTLSGLGDGQHTITVYATDAGGNVNSSTVTFTVDTTTPSIVAGTFSATNPSGQSVTVTFNASEQLSTIDVGISGAESGNLTRSDFSESSTGDGNYTYQATYAGGSDGTYTGTLHVAADEAGNDGAGGESDSVSVDTTGPPAPGNVAVTAVSGGNVTVSFDDVDDGATNYSVRRSTTSRSGYTEVGTVIDDDSANYTFTDTATSDGTTYYYVIVAVDGNGNDGPPSAEESATADGTAPTITNFSVANPSGTQLNVSFDSDESLDSISVSITGDASATLTNFQQNGSTYYATSDVGTDGTFTATLDTATDSAGNDGSNSESDTISIDTTAPTADAGSNQTVDEDTPVNFDGSNSGDNIGVTTYTWDFGDGNTSTGETVSHTYAEPGTYTVTLNVSDAAGNFDVDTLTVTVNDTTAPLAPSMPDLVAASDTGNSDTDNVTSDSTPTLTGTAEANATVTVVSDADGTLGTTTADENGDWSFTPGSALSGGTHNLTVTATDEAGNTGSESPELKVIVDTAAPTASGGSNQSVDEDTQVDFDGASSTDNGAIASYEWDFGDGNTSTGETVSHTYAEPGTYTVTLNVSDAAGNTDEDTLTVTVNDTTSPTADAGANQTVDEDSSVNFDGSSSTDNVGVTSYEWDFGDGTANETGATPTHTYADPGLYTVTLTVTDAAGNQASDSLSVTVNDTTAPTISEFNVSNPSGQEVRVSFNASEQIETVTVAISGTETATLTVGNFSETATGDGNYTYEATYQGSADGAYNVSLTTAADAAGNDGAAGETDSVTVGNLTVSASAEASSYVVAVGSSLELRANESTVPEDATVTYEWDIGDDGSVEHTGKVVDHTFTSPGTTNVTLTVTANGVDDSETISIDVRDEAAPSVTLNVADSVDVNQSLAFDGSSSTDNVGITAYEWEFGDGTTSSGGSLTQPSHTYSEPGSYTVTLTVRDAADNTDTATATVLVRGPTVSIDSTAIEFGEVSRNSTATESIQITNDGTVPLSLTEISIGGQNASAFDLSGSATSQNMTVRSGETRPLAVAFSPASVGVKSGTLTFSTNDTASSSVTIALNGSGVASDLGANQTVISFGDVETGSSDQATVTISNNGSSDVELTAANIAGSDAGQFDVVGNALSTIPAGGTHDVTVAFEPTATGDHSANLQVKAADGSSLSVSLDGTGVGPDIHLPSDEIEFVPVGEGDSAVATAKIKNYGTRSLSISNVNVTGTDADQFSVTNVPETIGAGGSSTFKVRFSPDSTGNFTATITIASNDPDEPTTEMTVSGKAVGANIGIDKRTVNFGNVTRGQTVYMNLTVSNRANSKANLTIDRTSLVGKNPQNFEVNRGDAPFTLAPGESHDIEVAFTPLASGTKQAQLQIFSDAENEPQLDVWLSNTRTYIVVQQSSGGSTATENLAVTVDGNNVVTDDDLAINVSRPGTMNRNVGFDELNMTFKPGGDFNIEVVHAGQPVGSDGVTYEADNTDVLEYVRLNHTTLDPDGTYDNTTVRYRVKKSALPDGVGSKDATLHRWNTTENRWNEMPGRYVSESASHYIYAVETPGFSQFAVTAPTQNSNSGASVSTSGTSSFVIESTSINRTDLHTGESARVDAVITNEGSAGGTYTADLEIDRTVTSTQNVYLAPGETETVTFIETFAEPGSFQVSVSGSHVSAVTVSQAEETSEDDDTGQDDETAHDDSDSTDDDQGPTENDGGSQVTTDAESGSATVDDHPEDCELFGFDFGKFIVCWYWWLLLLAVIGIFVGYWLRNRFRDEDDDW